MALSAEVTLTAGAVAGAVWPVGTELVQATLDAPAGPASCNGIDVLAGIVVVPVLTVAERVCVLLPTVRVQDTFTTAALGAPPAPVTVTSGLANAKYDEPVASVALVTVVAALAVVGTEAVLSVVPVSAGNVEAQPGTPDWAMDAIALLAAQGLYTRSWSCLVLARTLPTAPGWIFL
jgi:hypothetical protein